jgi:hypothetical protein
VHAFWHQSNRQEDWFSSKFLAEKLTVSIFPKVIIQGLSAKNVEHNAQRMKQAAFKVRKPAHVPTFSD